MGKYLLNLKKKNIIQEESGGRISEFDTVKKYERPKTAKPSSDNINELKGMVKELNEKLEQKRALVSELLENNNQLNEKFTVSFTEYCSNNMKICNLLSLSLKSSNASLSYASFPFSRDSFPNISIKLRKSHTLSGAWAIIHFFIDAPEERFC